MDIGVYHLLEVLRSTPHGLFLGDAEGNSVLLPGKDIPEGIAVGEHIEVYVYKDNQERLIATTQEPRITLYECALLPVTAVGPHGAFVDYGIDKELLVPFREQEERLQKGQSYLVYLYLDGQTDRLAGSTKIAQFLDDDPEDLEEGEEVHIVVWKATDLGFKVIVNYRYSGLLYSNEIFEALDVGAERVAYVHRIRPDGKLDIRLQPEGHAKVEPNAERILEELERRGGVLLLHDKSSPEQIKAQLGMSKKTFKKAIGGLYKARRIDFIEQGIRLLD